MSSALPAAIAMLSSADPSERAAGAREIYRSGRQAADEASRDWRNDAEFAALIENAKGADRPDVTVGLAVNPITFDAIRDANGSPHLADVPPDQDAKEFELHFDANVALDILTTRDPSRPGRNRALSLKIWRRDTTGRIPLPQRRRRHGTLEEENSASNQSIRKRVPAPTAPESIFS